MISWTSSTKVTGSEPHISMERSIPDSKYSAMRMVDEYLDCREVSS